MFGRKKDQKDRLKFNWGAVGDFEHDMSKQKRHEYTLTRYDKATTSWPQHVKERVVDNFPDIRDYANWFRAAIETDGGVIAHGKFNVGKAFHDYKNLYSAGLARDLSPEASQALKDLLPLQDMIQPLCRYEGIAEDREAFGVFFT